MFQEVLADLKIIFLQPPTMNGSKEDNVEAEEAALAELERELETRWGESVTLKSKPICTQSKIASFESKVSYIYES